MLTIVVGTRPQIIKTSPVIARLEKEYVEYEVLHTGQHYDFDMFDRFCMDFNIGGVKLLNGGYDIYDTARKLKDYFEQNRPKIVFVPGDVDSAFIAATVASKLDIPVAHLEAGVRQSDMFMQEEKNRRCIDHMSTYLFCPTQRAFNNLHKEGVLGTKAFVGDTNYDLYLSRRKEIDEAKRYVKENLYKLDDCDLSMTGGKFGVLTLHRRENVDDKFALQRIMNGIENSDVPFIFPIHPRTEKMFKEFDIPLPMNVSVVKPADYDVMMALLELSSVVVTDSGGLQKEAYFAMKRTVTIAEDTPWLETVEQGTNVVITNKKAARITSEIKSGFDVGWVGSTDNRLFGSGNASEYIVDILMHEEVNRFFRRDKS